jgi:hypothetical protein
MLKLRTIPFRISGLTTHPVIKAPKSCQHAPRKTEEPRTKYGATRQISESLTTAKSTIGFRQGVCGPLLRAGLFVAVCVYF